MSTADNVIDIRITRALGRVVVTPHGALDRTAAPLLRHLLADLIDDQGNLDVVVDARQITAIDVAAIDVLIDASQRISRLGGTLEITTPPQAVRPRLDNGQLTVTPRYPGQAVGQASSGRLEQS